MGWFSHQVGKQKSSHCLLAFCSHSQKRNIFVARAQQGTPFPLLSLLHLLGSSPTMEVVQSLSGGARKEPGPSAEGDDSHINHRIGPGPSTPTPVVLQLSPSHLPAKTFISDLPADVRSQELHPEFFKSQVIFIRCYFQIQELLDHKLSHGIILQILV